MEFMTITRAMKKQFYKWVSILFVLDTWMRTDKHVCENAKICIPITDLLVATSGKKQRNKTMHRFFVFIMFCFWGKKYIQHIYRPKEFAQSTCWETMNVNTPLLKENSTAHRDLTLSLTRKVIMVIQCLDSWFIHNGHILFWISVVALCFY